jgi:hypothetical protein
MIYNHVLFHFLIFDHTQSIHSLPQSREAEATSHHPAHLENQINQGEPRPQQQPI